MRIIAALTVPVLTLGAALLTVSPASAHTPQISADCNGVHVGATAYEATMANRWSVTIDGKTQSGTFGSSFDQTFPVPQDGATTEWSAFVEAADGNYHGEDAGTVGPCGTPPPTDACTDLPGPQPEGTPCTPPPDVQRSSQQTLDGCAVTFQGTDYGAGVLTYDEQFTDTYVFNEQTNVFDLVTDTTPTIANVDFSPWSVQEQVDHGCTKKSTQPPAEHSKHSWSHVDCGDQVRVTWTVTTRTPYVYDEKNNTWVPGKTVKHKTKHVSPVAAGRCNDTEVKPTQSVAHPPSAPSVVPAAADQLPTVIDAGLAAAPAEAATPTAAVAAADASHEPRLPVLLVLSGGLLLLVGGALKLRRG